MQPINTTNYNEAYNLAFETVKADILSAFTGKAQQDDALGSSPNLYKLGDYAGGILYAQLLYILAKQVIDSNLRVITFDSFLNLNSDYAVLKQCAACQGLNLESIIQNTGIESLFAV